MHADCFYCTCPHRWSFLQYWDSHCSTFSKLPILALVNPGSCPRGLEPALFLQLLSRLTDLQQWQIWDLWTSLDIHSCGFVSAAAMHCCTASPHPQSSHALQQEGLAGQRNFLVAAKQESLW